jgi:hypothetical protein
MTRMVAAMIVGWVTVIGTGAGIKIIDMLDITPNVGALILISSVLLAGTITLLVGMIGAFIVYVEHKLNQRESKKENDIS